VKVKSQWQRAVRKISVSSGYNSCGSSTSSTPVVGGPDASPTGQANRVRRTSMDKPNWGVRVAYGGQAPDLHHYPTQARTRHLSLSSSVPPPSYCHYSQSPPRVVYDEQGLTKSTAGSKVPVGQSPPPPVVATLAMVLESKPSPIRKSSSPDDCDDYDDDEEDDDDVDPMTKLPYVVGKATPFPDGSEAVMIDSALAHNLFTEETVSCPAKLFFCHKI
jgi:hypothetical protein